MFPCLIPSWKGSSAPFDANIWITGSDVVRADPDPENELLDFRNYYNHHRTLHSREGQTPDMPVSRTSPIWARFAGKLTV
jgi:hypothetical protein